MGTRQKFHKIGSFKPTTESLLIAAYKQKSVVNVMNRAKLFTNKPETALNFMCNHYLTELCTLRIAKSVYDICCSISDLQVVRREHRFVIMFIHFSVRL